MFGKMIYGVFFLQISCKSTDPVPHQRTARLRIRITCPSSGTPRQPPKVPLHLRSSASAWLRLRPPSFLIDDVVTRRLEAQLAHLPRLVRVAADLARLWRCVVCELRAAQVTLDEMKAKLVRLRVTIPELEPEPTDEDAAQVVLGIGGKGAFMRPIAPPIVSPRAKPKSAKAEKKPAKAEKKKSAKK